VVRCALPLASEGIHFGIDHEVLWGTVTDDLKPLVPLLTTLLAQQSDDH
jgi:uncharacterized protein with HEPN domain